MESTKPGDLALIGYGGALGGAKSACIAEMMIIYALSYPGAKILCVRETRKSVEESTLIEFKKAWPWGFEYENKAKLIYHIRMADWKKDVVSTIQFDQAHNFEEHKSKEFQMICVDEADGISLDAATTLTSRLRGMIPGDPEPPRYIFLACSNPEPGWFQQWFYERVLDEAATGAAKVHFVRSFITDNPHVDPEKYVQRLILTAGNNRDWIQRMIEGRFDAFEGQVFSNFSRTTHVWSAKNPDGSPKFNDKHVAAVGGLDFGGNEMTAHPCTGVVRLIFPSGRDIVVSEFKDRGPGVEGRQVMWMQKEQARWGKILWYADKNQSSWIQSQTRVGAFNIKKSQGKFDSREYNITKAMNRFEKDGSGLPGTFYLPECTEFEKEMIAYKRGPDGKVVRKGDDVVDAFLYSTEHFYTRLEAPSKRHRNLPSVA